MLKIQVKENPDSQQTRIQSIKECTADLTGFPVDRQRWGKLKKEKKEKKEETGGSKSKDYYPLYLDLDDAPAVCHRRLLTLFTKDEHVKCKRINSLSSQNIIQDPNIIDCSENLKLHYNTKEKNKFKLISETIVPDDHLHNSAI